MIVLVLYGAFCLFCLIAFLIWASFAKLRPDLDEPELDLQQLERLRKLASGEQSDPDPRAGGLRREDLPPPARRGPVKDGRRGLFQSQMASRHRR
jgi:hypothetical protein